MSVGGDSVQGNHYSELPRTDRAISADGRFVAFMSYADNLVAGDTNSAWDIFVRDRLSGITDRVSVATGGGQGNGSFGIDGLSISSDGRYVAFEGRASNLVAADTNGAADIFVHDRVSGVTERASVDTGGNQGNSDSWYPALAANGRYVAFASRATDLVAGDTNGTWDVFVRDRLSGTTERVSVGTGGAQGNGDVFAPSISSDGRYVAFEGLASNLVAADTNGTSDVFVHDRLSGTTERVSVATAGTQGNASSAGPSISSDGRCVAFHSYASNLVSGDTNGLGDAFVHDRQSHATERVSVATGGAQANNASGKPSISRDGRYVAFGCGASNLVPGPAGYHILLRDRLNATTERVSVATGGIATPFDDSEMPSISPDGRYVAFRSYTRNLVPGDSNGSGDVFVHDRGATGFTPFCEPGLAGVLSCPCSNPPSGPGRGCDNSSSTGGAGFSASGIAYLSIDSLVFTTSDERPGATSILFQAASSLPQGAPFGQGVRCVQEPLVRLYVKTASGGSITAPDFASGDPTISARSAALGHPIQPGRAHSYFVAYRDPVVLGGCQAASTLNATQAGQVAWWP